MHETYGVKQAQERFGNSDPVTTLRHYVRPMMAARTEAVTGLDEVTRAALERAEEKAPRTLSPSRTTSSRSPAAADTTADTGNRRQALVGLPSGSRSSARLVASQSQ